MILTQNFASLYRLELPFLGLLRGNKCPKEVVSSFEMGKTIAFNTGWSGHFVDVLIHDNYMMVINRGQGLRTSTVELFKINRRSNLS